MASFQTENTTTTGEGIGYYTVSGASTVAATAFMGDRSPTATQAIIVNGITLVSGLTPGSNTFKLQYSRTASTQTFSARRLSVIPL